MTGSDTDTPLIAGPSVVPREPLEQTASYIETLQGKFLSLRRRQLLVMLTVFVVIVVVLQVQGQFFHDLRMESSNPQAFTTTIMKERVFAENASNVVKKTAFEAFTVASDVDDDADHNNDASHIVDRTEAGHEKDEGKDDEVQSQSGNSFSNVAEKNEQIEAAKSHDKNKTDTSRVVNIIEQDDRGPSYQNKT